VGVYAAWVRKVDRQRYGNKTNHINYMQFSIITISFTDFTSDLTWGCQVLLAGGKGYMFGVASLAVTIFVMAYNMRKLHAILFGGNDWAKLNNEHKNKFLGTYTALFMLTTTDMELLCLFPWAKDFSMGSDGFPHPDAVAAAHSSGYIEDSLQILCWILHAALTGGVALSGVLTFVTSVGGSILRMGTQMNQRSAFAEESDGAAAAADAAQENPVILGDPVKDSAMEDLKKSRNYGKASVDEIEVQLCAVEASRDQERRRADDAELRAQRADERANETQRLQRDKDREIEWIL